jgi:hypothetical protein
MEPVPNSIAIPRSIADLAKSMISSSDAAGVLESLITERTPASFIRLGDGEAVLMSDFALLGKVFDGYVVSHFGPNASGASIRKLSGLLKESIGRATMIGLRDDMLTGQADPGWFTLAEDAFLEQFRNTFKLRETERENIDFGGARRLTQLNLLLSNDLQFASDAVMTSAWSHFDWAYSDFLSKILLGQKRIGVISCHPEIAQIMERHGLAVDYYPVPTRYRRRKENWTPHFPDRFEVLMKSLHVEFTGQVFLVGAGICGKVYCGEIHRQGGIGIDIGAVCDAWLGLSTRPMVLKSKCGAEAVPEEMTLDYQLQNSARGT